VRRQRDSNPVSISTAALVANRLAAMAPSSRPRRVLYIGPQEEARFRALGTACGRLEDTLVCVVRGNADPFRNALRDGP
jgi:hypothetical protein